MNYLSTPSVLKPISPLLSVPYQMPSINPQKHSTASSFLLGVSLLLRYSEDMPEVGLDIVLKGAEIADHGKKLGASTEREREQLQFHY